MQSLFPFDHLFRVKSSHAKVFHAKVFHAKLFRRAFVAVVSVSFCTAPVPMTMAQVYQVRPDGTLIYQPRYVYPNLPQPNLVPQNYPGQSYPGQVYPGQIINGERVVGPSVPTTPLSRPEAVNPPPPISNSDQIQKTNQDNQQSSASQRPDKIPKTNFPIPAGPALESEPETASASPPAANPISENAEPTDPASFKTPENPESSITQEAKNDPPQQEMPVVAPTELELPQEEPTPPTQRSELSDIPSSDNLSLDEAPSEEAPSEEIAPDDLITSEPLSLDPPTMDVITDEAPDGETSEEALAIDPAAIDEDILAEIKKIRDQLGGGISETLKDVDQMPSFGAIEITPPRDESETAAGEISPEELFNEELRSVMSEQESKNGSGPEPLQADPSAGSSPSPSTSDYADRTQELRACARELEQLAGRLETIEAYDHADRLRRQAAEIWTAARKR